MDTLAEHPIDWIRQIPGDLFDLDESPLLGYPPPFPWEDFTKKLKDSLQIECLNFSFSEWQWRSKDELFAGLGDRFKCLSMTAVPLSGNIYWIMPEQEISNLMGRLLCKQPIPTDNIDADFREAFYRFLTIEVLGAFEKVDFDKKLSLSLMQNDTLPASHCLCLDIAIGLGQDKTMHGRLLLSPEFRKSWMQRYQQQQSNAIFTSPIANKLDVIVHLEAGNVSLKPSEWRHIQIGDLILLDKCSLEPDEDKGRVMLVINGVPFFRGKIKQGSIKILEHPLYHEVDTVMSNPPENDNKEENDEDFLSDSDLDSELDSEIEDNHKESKVEEEEEFEIEDEELSDLDLAEEKKQTTTSTPTETPPAAISQPIEKLPSSPPTSIEDLPLNIVIEVGRLQMSIKKLAELQPGNMLDLNIHPEAGIDLVVNGKRIAKGELLRIGENLGVRIVELP